MKVTVVNQKKNNGISMLLDFLICMSCYTLVLVVLSALFKSVYIENVFWAFVLSILLQILNKTIKPILVRLTLPITAITLGVFYPFINIIMLYIANLILRPHFSITNSLSLFFVSIFLSFMNIIVEKTIINRIVGE